MSAAARITACVGRSHCNTSSVFGHFCSRHSVGQVCHGPILALGGAGSRNGERRPSREGRAKEKACLGRLGVRKMLQGRSTQKLSWNQPSPTQIALPRGLCCLRGGEPWNGLSLDVPPFLRGFDSSPAPALPATGPLAMLLFPPLLTMSHPTLLCIKHQPQQDPISLLFWY